MSHPKSPCPDCGAPKGTEAAYCRRCAGLRRRFAPCGTESAYRRHRRDGESPCRACIAAHTRAEKDRLARRRAERAARRRARRICPDCGGEKSPDAKACRDCRKGKPLGRRAAHGTESGYQYERRHGLVTCDACRKAHAAEMKRNADARPRPRPKPVERVEQFRICPDCGQRISHSAKRCRRCAVARRLADLYDAPTGWVQRGGVWRAAS